MNIISCQNSLCHVRDTSIGFPLIQYNAITENQVIK